MDYDAIVAGGGMAGLMAATTMANDGLKVLVVERQKDIAAPARADASIFYWKFMIPDEYLEPVNVVLGTGQRMLGVGSGIPVTAKFEFPTVGCSYEYTGPILPYYNYLKMSPSGYHAWCIKNELWGLYLSRSDILRSLFEKASKTSAEFMLGSIVLGVENTARGAVVRVKTPMGERTFESRKVVAADGHHSKVVESLGLNRDRASVKMHAYCYILEGVTRGDREYGSWIAWDYPSLSPTTIFMGQHAENGNNNLDQITATGDHASAILDNFMKNSRYASWFSKSRILRRCSTGGMHHTPTLSNPIAGNVIIIGDAISVESFIQGAIAGGYQAAKAIKREFNGEPGFSDYTKWLHGAFAFFCVPDHFHQKTARHLFHLARPDDDDVDYVYKLIEDRGLVYHPSAFAVDNVDLLNKARPAFHKRLSDAIAAMKERESVGGWQARQPKKALVI
jgi:flavin-dependent dehydrogenase